MISADALIHAVQLRMQVARHWRRAPGDFPAGWQQWFDSMHERVGAVTGAGAEAIVAEFVQRPLSVPPRRMSELTRWQAFTTLWQQEWHAQESSDERRWHWIAAGVSGCWHLLLVAILAWLMYLDLFGAAHPPPKGEEALVQVEFIGDGTPEEIGGGPESETIEPEQADPAPIDPAPIDQAATAQPSETPATTPIAVPSQPLPDVAVLPSSTPSPTLSLSAPEIVQREIPQPAPPEADQPLMVSEPVPDRSEVFVLPSPVPRIEVPLEAPELIAPAPAIEVAAIPPAPRRSVQRLPQAQIEQPALQPVVPDLAVRDLPAPLPRATVPVIQPEVPAVPAWATPAPHVREREIPSPPARERETASAPPVAATAGPEKTPAPGGWPSPERADDWGSTVRDILGAQSGEPPGLYGSDGSVRLAETPGSAAPGQPPGTITEEIADLDRAGTWLRRPPNDYEPTAFDQYWRPNESLLAEWVRRSVNTVRIPIPGTNKYIECTTVMLIMGGSCGIGDPNLNEQPATARPPPDVPFKPELQEGNGSAPPPAG